MLDLKKLTGLAAAALLASAVGASAAVVTTLVASSPQNGAANNADVFAPTYSAVLPTGASWSAAPTLRSSTIGGISKSPFVDTPLGGQSYWSVGPDNPTNPAVLGFATGTTSFSMLWGSIDSYNSVTFTTTSGVFAVTGSYVAGLIGGPDCGSPANFECVGLFNFTLSDLGEEFLSAIFFSDGANALEFALVPLPAAAWLMLAGLGGLGLVARRRKAA